MTLLLSVTTWHALLAAEFINLMPAVKPLERNIILVMVIFYCAITTRSLKGDQLPAQLAALTLALLVGRHLVAYFGLGVSWSYLLMVVAFFFPVGALRRHADRTIMRHLPPQAKRHYIEKKQSLVRDDAPGRTLKGKVHLSDIVYRRAPL